MKNQALQYYMHDGPDAFRFELAGDLNQEGAQRLTQAWRTATSVIGFRRLIVDMTFVTSVDEQGQALISRWHLEGVSVVANSTVSRDLAESVLGRPLPPPAKVAEVPNRTWLRFRPSFILSALLVAAILFPQGAFAATLKSETAAAWQDYIENASANLQDRVRPGGCFLWTFENAERTAEVRGGEIVVAPASSQNPRKVPGGLIHHWIGAAFLPGVRLDEILEVTRDYDRYKEFFHPYVIDSKAMAHDGSEDRFSMLLMNRAFILATALDADYQATNVRVDDHRFYSVSRTTRIQEVEDYGKPGESRKPEGEGLGYIWKLYSIARMEQRDDGVYLEIEAIALSRDIPAVVRLVADPIVRRVSRNALLTSLEQTERAVRRTSSADTSTSAMSSNKGSAFSRAH